MIPFVTIYLDLKNKDGKFMIILSLSFKHLNAILDSYFGPLKN